MFFLASGPQPISVRLIGVFFARKMHSTSKFAMTVLSKYVCMYSRVRCLSWFVFACLKQMFLYPPLALPSLSWCYHSIFDVCPCLVVVDVAVKPPLMLLRATVAGILSLSVCGILLGPLACCLCNVKKLERPLRSFRQPVPEKFHVNIWKWISR